MATDPKPASDYLPGGPECPRTLALKHRVADLSPGTVRVVPTLDHVVWAVPSIAHVSARVLEEHGLVTVAGGSHPAWGTSNAIIPLSGAYLELVEVTDPDAPRIGFTGVVAAAAAEGGRPCMWCLQTGDIEADAAPRGLQVVTGQRDNPDGSVITWRVAGMAEACTDPRVPFLIQWDDPANMPGAIPVRHPAGPCRITHVDIGPDGPRAIEISCSGADFTLP